MGIHFPESGRCVCAIGESAMSRCVCVCVGLSHLHRTQSEGGGRLGAGDPDVMDLAMENSGACIIRDRPSSSIHTGPSRLSRTPRDPKEEKKPKVVCSRQKGNQLNGGKRRRKEKIHFLLFSGDPISISLGGRKKHRRRCICADGNCSSF
jgi:hypothetical protein